MVKELIRKCILCKHGKFALISKQVRDSKKHKIIRCLKCNHMQLYPIPTLNDEKKFYDENLQDKNINDVGSIKRARRKMMPDNTRRAELVSKIITKRSRILEIGSGHGFFLDIMKKNGYDISGFEISKEKRKYSKKVTKVPVLDININEKIPTVKPFDIVVLFHTLEHIIDPVILLKNIKKLLKPKGKVLVEVPNCDDFHLGLNKFYKEFYWERARIHYFNSTCAFRSASSTTSPNRSGYFSLNQPIIPSGKKTTMITMSAPSATYCQPKKNIQKPSLNI